MSLETRKAKQALSAEDFGKRRNDDDSVQSARERYMERKYDKFAFVYLFPTFYVYLTNTLTLGNPNAQHQFSKQELIFLLKKKKIKEIQR